MLSLPVTYRQGDKSVKCCTCRGYTYLSAFSHEPTKDRSDGRKGEAGDGGRAFTHLSSDL